MEMRCIIDEFNYSTKEIDECTGNFPQLQKTMTIALERYQGCHLVGMQAHMLGRLVHAAGAYRAHHPPSGGSPATYAILVLNGDNYVGNHSRK